MSISDAPPAPRPPPAADARRELRGGGGQEVRRRPGRPARRADRLLRLRLAVPAAARVRDDARVRAAGRPDDCARQILDGTLGQFPIISDQLKLHPLNGSVAALVDRPRALAARRPRHHQGGPERLQPRLERALQAPPGLPPRAAARPGDARDLRLADRSSRRSPPGFVGAASHGLPVVLAGVARRAARQPRRCS